MRKKAGQFDASLELTTPLLLGRASFTVKTTKTQSRHEEIEKKKNEFNRDEILSRRTLGYSPCLLFPGLCPAVSWSARSRLSRKLCPVLPAYRGTGRGRRGLCVFVGVVLGEKVKRKSGVVFGQSRSHEGLIISHRVARVVTRLYRKLNARAHGTRRDVP